jgi:peptide/nickel transport system permease protein
VIYFFKRYWLVLIGSVMLLPLLFMSFFGDYLPFVDKDLEEILYLWDDNHNPVTPAFAPSEDFLLGTDRTGKDMLSLIVIGAKETLLLVFMITVIRYVLAIPLAYLAHKRIHFFHFHWNIPFLSFKAKGSFGVQHLVNWLNGTFTFIPTIIIILLIATLPPLLTIDERPIVLMFIIATVEIGRVANMIKIEFDQIASKEFIEGGIAVGVSPLRLLYKYYLPFLYEKLLISMVADFGKVMFLLGQLGFIGVFLSQELIQEDPGRFILVNDSITWPTFFMNAFRDIRSAIWIPFYPALAITYSIFTFNVLAQGLQHVFNTRERHLKG